MRIAFLFCLGFVALSTVDDSTRQSSACCMVPRSYEGTIGQSAQEAILFFDEGREELILRINYHITGKSMPEEFAWIVTVPNQPTRYALADAAIFKEVFDWTEKKKNEAMSKDWRAAGTKTANGLELGTPATVGPYDIQPVRALGIEALTALNTWLAEHGFPTEDVDHMKYFVEKKFTFLCIRVRQGEGAKGVDKKGLLPPLQISFATDRPYYPLKFSSRQGIFDVNLTMLTRKPISYKQSAVPFDRLNFKTAEYWRNIKVTSDQFPKALKDAMKNGDLKSPGGDWKLNVVEAIRVNEKLPIANWDSDIFFSLE